MITYCNDAATGIRLTELGNQLHFIVVFLHTEHWEGVEHGLPDGLK
jgi:hypothetical protein